jgi:DNA-binding response OmpR family regulator
VVVVTAKSQESDKFWAKETGADDYLTKPFEMEELLQKIQDNLQEDKKTA